VGDAPLLEHGQAAGRGGGRGQRNRGRRLRPDSGSGPATSYRPTETASGLFAGPPPRKVRKNLDTTLEHFRRRGRPGTHRRQPTEKAPLKRVRPQARQDPPTNIIARNPVRQVQHVPQEHPFDLGPIGNRRRPTPPASIAIRAMTTTLTSGCFRLIA
jgi:hypothetical protein